MKLFSTKNVFVLICILITNSIVAQGTLEWTLNGRDTARLNQISTSDVTVSFLKDVLNPVVNSALTYSYYSPSLTATVSLKNQQRSTILTNTTTVVPGITFGSRNSPSNNGIAGSTNNPQVVEFTNIYNVFGANIPAALPKNNMFVSSPSAAPAPPTDLDGVGGSGLSGGFDPQAITGATGPSGQDANFGIALYSCVEPLADVNADKAGRFYYGDVVINFNRPVVNPVIHVGGLGGSYNYEPSGGGPRQISYYTTELELVNDNLSSTFMGGNPFLQLDGNNILNGALKPNAGSVNDGSTSFGFSNYGAASGSIRINGTVQTLTYKVYLRGSALSDFGYSKKQADIISSNRDPFNGDLWYLSISLDRPIQQISGNVFVDRDALTDNNINQSLGVANPKTNIGGNLFANLLNSSGNVVASMPVSSDGVYLFDNVPVGFYSVQLTTIPSLGTYTSPAPAPQTLLPAGWVNTGEFIGSGTGNDFNTNGRSSTIILNANDIKVQVNFGIEQLPESMDFTRFIPRPLLNNFATLNSTLLPGLMGSDPEDQPTLGSLSGKKVKIDNVPSNAELYYNGSLVFAGQVISNYNPALLQVKFTSVPPTVAGEIRFNYSYIDVAGLPDPTPALYIIRWPSENVVPIVLADFTATKNNCAAVIKWITTSEINADKFEIEYSTATNASFEKIGAVNANENSSTEKQYQYNFAMETGVVYYFRLKMISKDGTYSYSLVRQLSCNDVKSLITIAPNPAQNIFHISGMAKGKNTVSIFSKDGKYIYAINAINNKDIDISSLSAGIYIIKITNENGTTSVEQLVKY
jgi:Secretion system C-terminal sorting domain